MKVLIDELLQITQKLFRNLEQLGFNKVVVDDVDFYWIICMDDLHDLFVKDFTFGVGSFFDDWQEIEKIIKKERDIFSCDIERLGNVIKVIGDIVYTPKRFDNHRCDQQLIINTNDLFKLFEMILKKIKMVEQNQIVFNKNHYWKIKNVDVYDFSEKSLAIKPITMFLWDNWQKLRQIVSQNREIKRSDFEWLGDIFILVFEDKFIYFQD